ncbi:MAG: LptF/LptG family permease [bacterium]|nr:LptF/LptG family permease [bacterium]
MAMNARFSGGLRILDRYIGGEFIKSFAFALLAFSLIWLLYESFDKSKIDSDQPQIHLYLYLLLIIPGVVVKILPAALMFGVCFTVAQFTVSREMVAIFSAGGSFYRAIAPLLIVSLATSLLLFVFNDFLVTPANQMANEQEDILKKGTRQATVKNLIFQKNLRGREGYYFIYFFDAQKLEIIGGFNYMSVASSGRPRRMLQANKAVYQPENKKWILHAGREVRFTENMRVDGVESFEQREVGFPDDIDFFANSGRNANEMNVFELSAEIDRLSALGFDTIPYEVQMHSNLSFPLMCIILTIVGSIAGHTGSLRSGGPLIRAILISTITMFVYYLTFSLTESMGRKGVVHPALASWGPTGIFMGLAGLMVWRFRR